MIVNCNKCKKDFEMNVLTETVKGDIERVYFICPYCNEKYISFYLNSKIKKKQCEIRKITEQLKMVNSIGTKLKLQKRFKQLNNEIGTHMKELKERFKEL